LQTLGKDALIQLSIRYEPTLSGVNMGGHATHIQLLSLLGQLPGIRKQRHAESMLA
jgi:hypothetical protein